MAFDDWQTKVAPLLEAARRLKVAMTVPVIVREGDHLANVFFLVSKGGDVLGRYQKMVPTPGELRANVQPGKASLLEWEGLKIGGGICFDCYHPAVFAQQAAAGADLFLIPSLTPGGRYLDFYALRFATPVVLAYPAWSRIIDADGIEVASGGYRIDTLRFGFGTPLVTARINFDKIVLFGDINQQKMLDVQRAYGKKVRVRFNQEDVNFVLESRSEELGIQEVMHEFGLVSNREYFASAWDKVAASSSQKAGALS